MKYDGTKLYYSVFNEFVDELDVLCEKYEIRLRAKGDQIFAFAADSPYVWGIYNGDDPGSIPE